jgi:hypothetical protein
MSVLLGCLSAPTLHSKGLTAATAVYRDTYDLTETGRIDHGILCMLLGLQLKQSRCKSVAMYIAQIRINVKVS